MRANRYLQQFILAVVLLNLSGVPSFAKDERPAPVSQKDIENAPVENLSPEVRDQISSDNAAYEKSVTDITAVDHMTRITSDMAKFYLAVGTMNAWECFRSNDPTPCRVYAKSLKDPIGHLGFLLFILSSHSVSKASLYMSHGKFNGSFAGMAVGMFAQDIFSDVLHNPHMQEYRKTFSMPDGPKKQQAQREALNTLWHESVGNKDYWLSKVPDVIGMVGAGALSQVKFTLARGALNGASRTMHFMKNGKGALAVMRLRRGLKVYEAASQGLRIVWNGARIVQIDSVVGIGASIVETIIFLNFSNWIATPIHNWWDQTAILHMFDKSLQDYNDAVSSHRNVEAAAENLQAAWDTFRQGLLSAPQAIQARYISELDDIDERMVRMDHAMRWATGYSFSGKHYAPFDTDGPMWKTDADEWREEFPNEDDVVQDMLCGREPNQSVFEAKDLHGLILPYITDNHISTFKIVDVPGLCAHVEYPQNEDPNDVVPAFRKECDQAPSSCAVNGFNEIAFEKALDMKIPGWQALWQLHVRRKEFLAHDFTSRYEDAMKVVRDQVAPVRERLIDRYDEVLQKTMIETLQGSGRVKIAHSDSGFELPEAVVPNFEAEGAFWEAQKKQHPEEEKVYAEMLRRTKSKHDFAEGLLKYSEEAPGKRQLPDIFKSSNSEVDSLFSDPSSKPAAWEKTLQVWQGFVLQ